MARRRYGRGGCRAGATSSRSISTSPRPTWSRWWACGWRGPRSCRSVQGCRRSGGGSSSTRRGRRPRCSGRRRRLRRKIPRKCKDAKGAKARRKLLSLAFCALHLYAFTLIRSFIGPPPRRRCGRSGVRHLHVGQHRRSQGGDGPPPRPAQPPARADRRLRPGPGLPRALLPLHASTPRSPTSGPRSSRCADAGHRARRAAARLGGWASSLRFSREGHHPRRSPALAAPRRSIRARLPASLVDGGDRRRALPPEVVRRWAERVRVINVYGPTEATVCSSLGACDPRTWTRPLLGRPLPGVRYRVVDGALGAVPDGTPGELTIGGVGLALGYLGRPELTAERFVRIEGERVYRTFDRVVRRRDGEIEFLGRLDRQVKLRGRRIEPEEIEVRLASLPGVERAAVVARPLFLADAPRCLVAFVVPRDPGAEDLEPSLRAHLAEALPGWMIPSRFCFVRRPSPRALREGRPARAGGRCPSTARPVHPPAGRGSPPCSRRCGVRKDKVDAIAAEDMFRGTLGGDSMRPRRDGGAGRGRGPPDRCSERLGSRRARFGDLVAWIERGESDAGERRTAAELREDAERDPETAGRKRRKGKRRKSPSPCVLRPGGLRSQSGRRRRLRLAPARRAPRPRRLPCDLHRPRPRRRGGRRPAWPVRSPASATRSPTRGSRCSPAISPAPFSGSGSGSARTPGAASPAR